jgi:UDP-N-acetylmuramoyl-L-alanyl-D-glutamate--2,6-diaminopimelate ligase
MPLGGYQNKASQVRCRLAEQSRRIKIVGLAGLEGATTTSCLIASILTASGHKIGMLGPLGCLDGRQVSRFGATVSPPSAIAAWLRRTIHHGCTHAIVEVSPRSLRQGWLDGLALDVACLIHQPSDSGRGGGSREKIRCAANRLINHLAPEGLAIVSADDPIALQRSNLHDGPMLTVGIHADAEIKATILDQCPSEQTMLLSAGCEAMPVRTRMIGVRHAYYCLTAAAVGLAYGIDLATVVRGMEAIDYVPGHLERIECGQPFAVFVDRARTAHAIQACLATLREVIRGRIFCVFGADGVRSENRDGQTRRSVHAARRRLGRAVEESADLAVITDANPRDEEPQDIIEDILAGLKRPAEAEVIPDRAEAIAWVLSQAKPGDAVLITGAGRQNGPRSGERNLPDDCQVVRQWLYANQHE